MKIEGENLPGEQRIGRYKVPDVSHQSVLMGDFCGSASCSFIGTEKTEIHSSIVGLLSDKWEEMFKRRKDRELRLSV